MVTAQQRTGMRLLAWCLMPNHWHMVVWPREDGDLRRFFGWLTLTHTQRWHAHRHTTGEGHVYQGRYKSFLIETESYLASCCRYVERNALRAGQGRSDGKGEIHHEPALVVAERMQPLLHVLHQRNILRTQHVLEIVQ